MIDYTNTKEVLKMIVDRGELPQFIYKYASVETTELILKSSKLKFSKPTEFNDPFDCNITMDTTNSEQEINNYIKHLQNTQRLSEEQVTTLKLKCQDPKLLNSLANKSVKEVTEEFGITCFSKYYNNLVMWAHYSDNHKGACLKFDILRDPEFFMVPFHVHYSKNYPKINFIHLQESKTLAKALVETKSLDWSYENEIRILKRGSDLYTFSKNSLVEIIFGCKSQDADRIRITNAAVSNSYDNVNYKIGQISDSKFEILFKNY